MRGACHAFQWMCHATLHTCHAFILNQHRIVRAITESSGVSTLQMGGRQGVLASSLQGNLAASHHLHSTMDPGLCLPGPRSRPGFQEAASTRCSSAPSDVLGSPGSSLVLLAPSIHQGQHGACSSARSRCDPWHALIECICRMQQHSPSCSVQPSGQPDSASFQHSSGARWRMQQRMQQV